MNAKASGGWEQLSETLKERIDRLPHQPGVYLLKDREQTIVYVGKAKDLHARVRSYFTRSGDTRAFVPRLGRLLGDVETIVTDNEKEALLLENTLIKKHQPRFNVNLRDDKNYLVLQLDPKSDYPRLEVVRKMGADHRWYFGPYHSASSCRETLRVVNRHFKLRTCTDRTLKSRTRACLQYQIGRCPAPCVIDVDKNLYASHVKDVALFLKGQKEALLEQLRGRMQAAAAALNFEHAAELRDQIESVERTLQGQQVVGRPGVDQDVFGYYREGGAIDFAVLTIRGGKLMGRQGFSFSGQEFPDEELVSSFINLYYARGADVPSEVLIPMPLEDEQAKAKWLRELGNRAVQILLPQRGDKTRLITLAQRNAQSNFITRRSRHSDLKSALSQLQHRLRLNHYPTRIECYDVSHFHGQEVVASMTVLLDGELAPREYRHFKIKTLAGDDFSSLYETLSRRFRRAASGDAKWKLPQLIVIDGGKGQLSVAQAALKDAELGEALIKPDLVSLAKERNEKEDETGKAAARPERVFLGGVKDALRLRSNTSELYLLTKLRDEAHRFAITHHKKLRRGKNFRSPLDEIEGIGPKRKRQLLKGLGSLKAVQQASFGELQAIPGISSKAAEAVIRYFSGSTPIAPENDGGSHDRANDRSHDNKVDGDEA